MAKFRDLNCATAHAFRLDGMRMEFGTDGVIDATPEQEAILTALPQRCQRFERVEEARRGAARVATPKAPERKDEALDVSTLSD